MIKTIIIEDELQSSQLLVLMLKDFIDTIEVVDI
jgi:hypothetical protein